MVNIKKLIQTVILGGTLGLSSCALPALVAVPFLEKQNKKDIHGYSINVDRDTNIQAYDLNNDGKIDEALIAMRTGNDYVLEHLVASDANATKRAWLDMHYTREMTQEERNKLTKYYQLPNIRKISE